MIILDNKILNQVVFIIKKDGTSNFVILWGHSNISDNFKASLPKI